MYYAKNRVLRKTKSKQYLSQHKDKFSLLEFVMCT